MTNTVYVLGEWDIEGAEVHGVFSSETSAWAAVHPDHHYRLDVWAFEVDDRSDVAEYLTKPRPIPKRPTVIDK